MRTRIHLWLPLFLCILLLLGCGERPLVYSSIHEAVDMGNLDDVIRHLNRGVAVNAWSDEKAPKAGFTPLMIAAARGHLHIVKYLIDNGADINALSYNDDHVTPLILAAGSGHLDVVRYLVKKGADVNKRGSIANDLTPLMASVAGKNLDVVIFLVKKGADVHTKSATGYTALAMASEDGLQEIEAYLKKQTKAK